MAILPFFAESFRRSLHESGVLNRALRSMARHGGSLQFEEGVKGERNLGFTVVLCATIFCWYYILAAGIRILGGKRFRPVKPWPSPQYRKWAFIALCAFSGLFAVIIFEALIASAYAVNSLPFLQGISDIKHILVHVAVSAIESITTVFSIPRKGLLWGYLLTGEPVESEVRAILRLESHRTQLYNIHTELRDVYAFSPLGRLLYHPQLQHIYHNIIAPHFEPLFPDGVAFYITNRPLRNIALIIMVILGATLVFTKTFFSFGKAKRIQGSARNLLWYALLILPISFLCTITLNDSVRTGIIVDSLIGRPGDEAVVPLRTPGLEAFTTKTLYEACQQAANDGDGVKAAIKLFGPRFVFSLESSFDDIAQLQDHWRTALDTISSTLETHGISAFEGPIRNFYETSFRQWTPTRWIEEDFNGRLIPLLTVFTELDYASIIESTRQQYISFKSREQALQTLTDLQHIQPELQEVLNKLRAATAQSINNRTAMTDRVTQLTMKNIERMFNIRPIAHKYLNVLDSMVAYAPRLFAMALGLLLLWMVCTTFALFRLFIKNYGDCAAITEKDPTTNLNDQSNIA